MLNRLKKNNKKGFTLVELIVVLVILAILAALLIPALTKYIDKAKEKQIIAQTRQAVMAAQTLADEQYAIGVFKGAIQTALTSGGSLHDELIKLADVPTGSEVTSITVDTSGHVTDLTFKNAANKTCIFDRDSTGEVYDPQ